MCNEPDGLAQTHRRKTEMKMTFFCGMGRQMRSLPEKGVKLS